MDRYCPRFKQLNAVESMLNQKAAIASTETTDSHTQVFPSKWHTQSTLSLPFPMHKLLTIKVTKNIL